MAPTALRQREHTDAVIAALAAAGLAVGDGVRNTRADETGAALDPPCVVVHALPGGSRDGTLDDWVKHATLVYQLTCIGLTRESAEGVRDLAEVAMLGTISVPGRLIDVRRPDFGSDQVRRDDTVRPLHWIATPRWRLFSTPA